MDVVRRAVLAVVVAGACLVAGPAWAQEDPCAPGPDGQVPEMCQSGPVSDTGTVGMEPEPCPAQPVEPGDGVVDDGDQGAAAGEPDPDAPTEPEEQTLSGPPPGAVGGDGIICAFGIPISAPVEEGAPDTAAGAGGGTGVAQLPRTGPYDQLLALTAVGGGLLVAGAGAVAAGRRRRTG